ncbi:hypothetical protein TRFO_14461 [Tritrichomonas foetus]|uniref:Uncharacterized protein n=1 Tax=Tritrichomonas foetus TaxID=1144522 RepID=A0A1J4KVD3_9EUKA|nr:hypothetical protein [Tritrichomonas foetus]OHT15106.1 hypothetical protein TRFO_14461 [Tritrichomonas foetus]|eukprot:OHT15106.1 hypothetical protein TRFO_14461 [Tritrichomonas foetus]
MKENQLLRAQFEEAVSLTSQMEDLHKQNSALLTQVNQLKAEKVDLIHRLDILVQKDKETESRLLNEKASSNNLRGSDLTSMTKEIEKIKAQSKAQLDDIYGQLQRSEQEREKESVEKRLLISKLDRIIGEASRFFENNLQSVDEVLEALNGPKVCVSTDLPSVQPIPVQVRNAVQAKEAEMHKKIHKLKVKLNESEKAKEALDDDLKKLQRESQHAQQQLRAENTELKTQIEKVHEEMTHNERHYEANMNRLTTQNESLKNEVSKLKERVKKINEDCKELKHQLHMAQLQARTASPVAPKGSEGVSQSAAHNQKHDAQLEALVEKLQATVSELNNEISNANKKRDSAISQLKDKDNEIHNLAIQIEKVKSEFTALDTVHQETLLEVETLRQALITREKAKDEIKNAPKAKQPNPTIVKLHKALDEQKQKFYALQIVSGKQETRIQDQESEIRHLTARTRELEADLSRSCNEILELKTTFETRHVPTADDLLPPQVFRCDDFSPELSTQIAKIASNPSLQPPSKVQHSYKAIRKYFTKQIAMRDAALDAAFNENQTISNAVNQFLVDASIALCDQPVTFKDFFAQNAGKDIVEKIINIRADNAALVHHNELMKNALVNLKETFIEIGDANDPIGHVQSIKEKIEQLNGDVYVRNKKLRQYKSTLASTQAQAKSRENELLNEIQSLKFQVEDLVQQCKRNNEEIAALRQNNQRMQVELSDVNHTREDLESTIIQDQDEQIQMATDDLSKQVSKLREQLRTQKEQFDHLEIEYHDATEQLNRTRKQLQLVKTQKLQKDAEYDELVKISAEKEDAAANRFESEKQHLTESYENALQKLHEQCEQHRSDVEKFNASLAEEQVKLANLKATIAKVEKEKLKALAEMQTTKNQMKREKMLMESTIRSQKLQAEAQYNERLEEFKGRAEAEKRTLLAFGADSFRDFFNPGTTIDERSYKYVIEKAHEKLVQLAKSDAHVRRMVSACEQQTTEDAVAQLLLNSV